MFATATSYLLQLQAHLLELTTVAVRAHLEEARPQAHPHTIEAARQISGDIFGENEEIFPGKAQPHLLHEPYMSEEGAAGMLSQTLVDIARKVDQEAKTRGTLESTEFEAFRALVSSVYLGSLQKRAEYVETRERLLQQQHQSEMDKDKEYLVEASTEKITATPTKTPKVKRAEKEDGVVRERLPSPEEHDNNDEQEENSGVSGKNPGNGDGEGDGGGGDGNLDVYTIRPGVARPGHQACSGDIAQALVAIAMGEGFEAFSSSNNSAGRDDSSAPKAGGNDGKDSTGEHSPALAKGRRGVYGRGAKGMLGGGGAKGFKSGGGGNNNSSGGSNIFVDAQQQHLVRLQRESDNLGQASAALQFLSEDAAVLNKGRPQPVKNGEIGHGVGSEAEGQFPGLEWLAPHIIGRSIPMELRYTSLCVRAVHLRLVFGYQYS